MVHNDQDRSSEYPDEVQDDYIKMFLDNDLDAKVKNSKRKYRRLVAEKKRIFT